MDCPGSDILWPSVFLLQSGWPIVRWTPWERYLVAKCVTTVLRLTSGQMYPLNRDILWPGVLLLQSGWTLIRWTPRMRFQVRLTFIQTVGQAELLLFFPVAFPICDYKSSSMKVVPWCSNTPDWWWKDMHTLVWSENSLCVVELCSEISKTESNFSFSTSFCQST